MDEQSERGGLLTALTTERFVLQTANNSTYAEASARDSLYVMALSSSVVAGIAGAVVLNRLFYRCQRWPFADYDRGAREPAEAAGDAP